MHYLYLYQCNTRKFIKARKALWNQRKVIILETPFF